MKQTLTKKYIIENLKTARNHASDDIQAIQFVFQKAYKECKNAGDYQDKKLFLNAILFFAYEIYKPIEPYGYKTFDLIMSRSFPTTETYRNIIEEEGKNIFVK